MEGGRSREGCQASNGGEKPSYKETSSWYLDLAGDSLILELQVRSGAQLTRGLLSSIPTVSSSREVGSGQARGVTASKRAA